MTESAHDLELTETAPHVKVPDIAGSTHTGDGEGYRHELRMHRFADSDCAHLRVTLDPDLVEDTDAQDDLHVDLAPSDIARALELLREHEQAVCTHVEVARAYGMAGTTGPPSSPLSVGERAEAAHLTGFDRWLAWAEQEAGSSLSSVEHRILWKAWRRFGQFEDGAPEDSDTGGDGVGGPFATDEGERAPCGGFHPQVWTPGDPGETELERVLARVEQVNTRNAQRVEDVHKALRELKRIVVAEVLESTP